MRQLERVDGAVWRLVTHEYRAEAERNSGKNYVVNSEGKIEEVVSEVIDTTTDSADISDPSKSYILQGVDGLVSHQIDINHQDINTSEDLVYNITLNNYHRNMEPTWCESGLVIYNEHSGTKVTVNITLDGDNSIIGGNFGGIQLIGVTGAQIEVIFKGTGSLFIQTHDDTVEGKTDFVIEGISENDVSFEVEDPWAITEVEIGGSLDDSITDITEFFQRAKESHTSGCKFVLGHVG